VLTALNSPAIAQRGIVNGQLLERPGYVRGYPLYQFPGTDKTVFLDKEGCFSVEVLPGRYDLDVFVAPGARPDRQSVLIKANEIVSLTITGPDARGPWSQPSNIEKQTPPSTEDLVPMESVRVVYHPLTTPVQAHSLEFTVRYEMNQVGDSIKVVVIAEGRNTFASAISTCGCFSFWSTEFGLGPEQLMSIPLAPVRDWYKGPSLHVVPVECTTPRLECAPTTLAHGEAVTRSMSFAFRPADFATKTGELHIRTYYFTGTSGTEWHDAERVDLGTLAVPLRLPGTIGHY
jgi:hypothetical protein